MAEGWFAVPVGLPDSDATVRFEVGGRSLLLCNVSGQAHAIENRCPHAFQALDAGVLRGRVLECPLHGGKLDVTNGEPVSPPIRRRVARFELRRGPTGLEIRL